MKRDSNTCDLCGLPLSRGDFNGTFGAQTLRFCCGGCRMVYAMLMEATDSPDPARFRESELYRRCVAAGVVPASDSDLAEIDQAADPAKASSPASPPAGETLTVHLKVDGMWCPACAWVIENALHRQPGMHTAVCDFATDRLRCSYDPTRADPRAVEAVVRALGYTPRPMEARNHKFRRLGEFIRLALCALLAVNVMMLSWALYSGFFTSLSSEDIHDLSWPILIMTSLVLGYGGGPLFRKALWGLRAGVPGMEALVCLGAGAAYLYSLFNFAAGSLHLYFDTAAMLITLVLLGKMLESRAKARVRRDLEGFLALQPNKVRLCSARFPQGRFADISRLLAGDTFRVQAEEIVPADGRVTRGRGWVDESAVTGESRPQMVGPGDHITSGTRLLRGDVIVEAERVGRDAMIGQMIAVIEAGLARRTPRQSRTDRWLAIFVPLMVGLAAATAAITHATGSAWEPALVRGLTVLVMACPCALGIAVPLARIAGISRAGRQGILVRDFEAFQRSSKIDSVVFDKTGTLTHGRWSLERVEAHAGITEREAAALAAGLEQGVDHAIARAVAAYVQQRGIEAAGVRNRQAEECGVGGTFRGAEARIGSWAFVTRADEPSSPTSPAEQIFSPVYLSLNGLVCAVLWFGDKVRKNAGALVEHLRTSGCRVCLISGDARPVTAAVAAKLGIAESRGGLLPEDKARFVARLQAQGRCVMMVGDGINDAPALARSDLSVAVHRDTALTQQAAQVTLMRGDPDQLLDFLHLGARVNAKVAQNLTCAWVYNLIGLPIAMAGWLNPLVAVAAMLLSSMTVIGNTLMLVRRKSK